VTFFSPKVAIPLAVMFVAAAANEFAVPTLALYLTGSPFKYSVHVVGLAWSASSLMYVSVGPLIGMVDDKFEGKVAVPIMAFGVFVTAIGYFLLAGPAVWSWHSEVIILIGMITIGLGDASVFIPAYNNIFQYALHDDEGSQANATAALYNMVYSSGTVLGPVVGGWMSKTVGIAGSYNDCGVFLVLAVALVLVGVVLTWAFLPQPQVLCAAAPWLLPGSNSCPRAGTSTPLTASTAASTPRDHSQHSTPFTSRHSTPLTASTHKTKTTLSNQHCP